MTRVVLSWSGGKDSALALQALRRDPECEVVALLTTFTRDYDRVSMHGVRRDLVQRQAESLRLSLHEVWILAGASNAEYEAATLAVLNELLRDGVTSIAFGDLFLADIRAYRERLFAPTGWQCRFPIWGRDTAALARQFIADGFRARLCCVDTRTLPTDFCGRWFDAALLADLPPAVDPCGENGEFHTFVCDGPIFDEPLDPVLGAERRDGPFQFRDLLAHPPRLQETLT